jgi:hypothetical protein
MPVPSAEADKICEQVEDYIVKVAGGINVYDIRIFGDYDFSIIGRYLDKTEVRAALHVDGLRRSYPGAPLLCSLQPSTNHLDQSLSGLYRPSSASLGVACPAHHPRSRVRRPI